jgi:hypothetical protein
MKKFLAAAAVAALALPALAKNDALSLIPNEAVTVGVVRLAELRTSPLGSELFKQTDEVSTNGDAEKFLTEAGLKPSQDVDVIVVSTIPRSALGTDADVLVALDGRFNADRLTKALLSRGAVAKGGYLLLPEKNEGHQGAVAFPDGHLALVGTENAVATALRNRAAGGTSFFTVSGLGREAARVDPHATAWALVDVQRTTRITGAPHMPNRNPSAAAINGAVKNVSTVGLWATDAGDAMKLGAFGVSGDGETLQLVEDTVRGALSAMRLAVQDKQPELVPLLRRFSVSRSNDAVTVSGSVPADTFRKLAAEHKEHATR